MDRKVKTGAWLLVLAAAVPVGVQAQGKVEASVGADLVSGYIWRGQDLGNVSIQLPHRYPIVDSLCLDGVL